MAAIYSLGEWIKQRRKHLRLTQREIAEQCFCSVATIKKIESDQRRPSLDLADLLSQALQLSPELHPVFLECARGQRPVDALTTEQTGPAANTPAPQSTRRPTPLPLTTTPFIGRTTDLTRIAERLADSTCRLLTLIGPGGIGKTRLALAVARDRQENFNDGAVFVPLAAIEDLAGIVPAIAKILNLPLTGSDPAEQQLQRHLHSKNLLLVLDNFEQLVTGASLLTNLLANAPQLKLLITSRERLNLANEWLYPVIGFSTKQAIHLFEQAARRVQPYFDPTSQKAAIADICQQVDGLPLAIELAASWTRLMPCRQILIQIRQDFDFLSAGPRNVPARHQSLRALFDHSWQLLLPAEQETLARLSVFRGGFAPEEAVAVARASWPILAGLVDKSLVAAQANGRYDLHELTRQYVTVKLREANGYTQARQQHFDTYLDLAARLDAQLHGPDGITAYARLDQELDNLRTALRWGLETREVNRVLQLVNHLFFFWLRRGYWHEGEQWASAVVSQADKEDNAELCLALTHLSTFIALQGRYGDAAPYLPQALPMAHRLVESEPLVAALMTMAQATFDPEEAYEAWDKAIDIVQQDKKLTWRLAIIYSHYGDRLRANGRYPEAAARYRQSLELMRQMGNVDMIAYPLGNLGLLELQEGNLDEAHRLIAESVAIARASGNPLGLGDWIFQLGVVLLYLEQTDKAEDLLQEALTIFREMDNHRGEANVLACLGQVALIQKDMMLAADFIRQSFTLYRNLHQQMQQAVPASSQMMSTQISIRPDEADSLIRAALLFAAQERFEQAVTLFGVTDPLLQQSGHAPAPPLQASVDEVMAAAQNQLSEVEFANAWQTGRSLTPEQVFEIALNN